MGKVVQMNEEVTFFDYLAGGGGVTHAASSIDGVRVVGVLNHNSVAIRTNLYHHKNVKHYWADIFKQDERELDTVDICWASVECTQFSKAKGGADKNIGSYVLAWQLLRYFKHQQPLVIGIENVPEFKKWSPLRLREDYKNSVPGSYSALFTDSSENYVFEPNKERIGEEFEKWKQTICDLGYEYHELICNAQDYGIATRRLRYFAFFTRKGIAVNFPAPSHNENGDNGLQKHVACKQFIDLTNEGQSIFGRKYNSSVAKNKRIPLVKNTLARIAGGIKKYATDLNFIFQYYGTGTNVQSCNTPLHAIVTKDRHVVVSLEKTSFIADHCHQDVYNRVEEPITPILTWENKRYVNVCGQFINDYYGRHNTAHSLDGPANTITAENSKNIVSVHGNFITKYYKGDYHNQPTGIPYPTITTIDHNALVNVKGNFIAHQQNSNGNPAANVQSCNSPLHTITSTPKQQLISHSFECTNEAAYNEIIQEIIEEKIQFLNDYFTVSKDIIEAIRKGTFDFDIKMRFVYPEELSQISSFPAKYFTDPRLKLTKKEQVRLIGNAVPPEWARIILEPVIEEIKRYKASQLINQKLAKAL